MKTKGRPAKLADEDVIAINGLTAKTALQEASERRAVINLLVELGGRARVHELMEARGYDVRAVLRSLLSGGWLLHTKAHRWSGKMPRRTSNKATSK